MRTPRVYIDQEIKPEEPVILPQEKAHHIAHVLRMRKGESIILFNNTGYEFDSKLIEISKKSAQVEVVNSSLIERESPLKITLALAISRGQHMDYALQKAVELGVYKIVPLFTEFSNVKLLGERKQNKLLHWQNIIINATEQCGRSRLAQLLEPLEYNEWLDVKNLSAGLIMHPGSDISMEDIIIETDELTLMVGPEGGFSELEFDLACQKGYTPISFGPRILRAETAVVSGLSVAQQLWGDLK